MLRRKGVRSPGVVMTSEDAARERVSETLVLMRGWRMGPDGWDRVHHALERVQEAIGRRDVSAVHRAIDEIETYGPRRLAIMSEGGPPPEPTLELINTLINPPGGWPSPKDERRDGDDKGHPRSPS